jgi:hypothetical protein
MMKSVALTICLMGALFIQGASVHAQGLSAFDLQQTSVKAQKRADNLQWTPWLSAGEQIWKAVMRIEPRLKDVIGDGQSVSVATANVDDNPGNEIILYFGGTEGCGIDGCLYTVLETNGRYKRAFIAKMVKRIGTSLSVDGRYYQL